MTARASIVSLLLLPLTTAFLTAQSDDVLFFPPVLTVTLYSGTLPTDDVPYSSNSYTDDPYAGDLSADTYESEFAWIVSDAPYTEEKAIVAYKHRSRFATPLLPMIFFDHPGDVEIPERYQQFGGGYEASGYVDTSDIPRIADRDSKYYQILNVIGYRMQRFADALLYIEGGYSTEIGESAATAELRTEIVREYLNAIWGVDDKRVVLLPPRRHSTESDHLLRHEEARRVTFFCTDTGVLAPVWHAKYDWNYGAPSADLIIDLETHLQPAAIAGVDVEIRGEDTLYASASFPAEKGSRYVFTGRWLLDEHVLEKGERVFYVRCLIHLRDGMTRASNAVPMPMEISEEVTPVYLKSETLVEVPFFDFRDTSYSGSISAVIDSIAYYVERKPPSDSIRVRIGGLTEFGESPEFSEGEMLRLRDSVRQSIAEAFAKKHVRDSARRAEADAISDLKLISKFAEPVEIDYEMTEEERAAADSLLDAAFASMRKTQDYVVPPQLPGDSLLGLGRAETIRSRILSSGICGHCMFDYYGWDITRYVDLPEERYYQRSVTVLVSHGFKRPRD